MGGGGQPILDGVEMADVRGPRLYKLDEQRRCVFPMTIRESKNFMRNIWARPLGKKPISCCIPIIDVKKLFGKKLDSCRSGTV